MTRHPDRAGWIRSAAAVAAAAAACGGVAAGAAQAADGGACPNSVDSPYSLALKALTGPDGADVTIRLQADAASGCAVPDRLKKVQLKTYAADGSVAVTRNLTDVGAPSGVANLPLGDVPRDRRVEADVLVQTEPSPRTFVVRGATRTLLRPDLVVESVTPADPYTLTTRPLDVRAVVAELNGDAGADDAVVTIAPIAGAPLATAHVTVGPHGTSVVDFQKLELTVPMALDLVVRVAGSAPAETSVANNDRTVTVDVTEHELPRPDRVVFSSLGGFGAQFNQHLYAPITPDPVAGYADVEAKVKALQPQLVRIFYSENWEENRDKTHPDPEWRENLASFVQVCQLAQEAGATINVTFQSFAYAKDHPAQSMATFAQVLDDLVRVHGCTNVHWVTVGNEPNSTTLPFEKYEALYRALDAQLVARGLRDHIHLMAGDLVEGSGEDDHVTWMKWIGANMGDIVDAYSEHVYWWYDRPLRMEYRLRNTHDLVANTLPPEQRKPTYLMEFSVRGYDTCGDKPTFKNRYYADCTEIWKTNLAAFQQLWLNVEAAQLGFAGTSKWDAYWAVYDRSSTNQQVHWMTGTAEEGYPLWPTYHAMSLVFHTTAPGWRVLGVDPFESDDWTYPGYDQTNDQPEKEIAAFAGPNGELTLIGLDTHGRLLNGVSADPPSEYSIANLPANTTFDLVLWNGTGDGTNSIAAPVTTNAAGVARFAVPLQAAFALTYVPVS